MGKIYQGRGIALFDKPEITHSPQYYVEDAEWEDVEETKEFLEEIGINPVQEGKFFKLDRDGMEELERYLREQVRERIKKAIKVLKKAQKNPEDVFCITCEVKNLLYAEPSIFTATGGRAEYRSLLSYPFALPKSSPIYVKTFWWGRDE